MENYYLMAVKEESTNDFKITSTKLYSLSDIEKFVSDNEYIKEDIVLLHESPFPTVKTVYKKEGAPTINFVYINLDEVIKEAKEDEHEKACEIFHEYEKESSSQGASSSYKDYQNYFYPWWMEEKIK